MVTTVGYYVLRDEPWLPRALGGTGDATRALYTVNEAPSDKLKLYYMIQTGYHLQSLLYMVFLSPIRNDFIEMLLHHLVTLVLIVGSYLANYSAFGALVAFLHDIGDVSGCKSMRALGNSLLCEADAMCGDVDAIKSVVDSGNVPLVGVFYAGLLASWGYTRLYVFPVHLILPVITTLPEANPMISSVFIYLAAAMLGMLLLLHVYWYTLFLVMGYALLVKGKSEDIQEKCIDSESESDEYDSMSKPKMS